MSEVVKLKDFIEKKPDLVFSCECGGQLFYLNASFDSDNLLLECRACNKFVNNMKVEGVEEGGV